MKAYEDILAGIVDADPELLVGHDEYVLDCRNCPTRTPETVIKYRLAHLHQSAESVLGSGSSSTLEQLASKVYEWVIKAESDVDQLPDADMQVGLISVNGKWQLALSRGLQDTLATKGIDPNTFMAAFNDQNTAALSDEMNKSLEHAFASHPGMVKCRGSVEVGGRALCGASLQVEPCTAENDPLSQRVIIESVRRSIEAG